MIRDYKTTYQLMKRTKALSDRVRDQIITTFTTREGITAIDSAFALSSKIHALYVRLHQQYEDTKPQYPNDQ